MKHDDTTILKSDNAKIRDMDLLEELESHRGKFTFSTMQTHLARSQFDRDLEAAKIALLSPAERKRHLIRKKLLEKGAKPDDLRHIHSVVAICSLPYKQQPIEVREYERRQGRMSLVVEAGKLLSPDGERIAQPLPHGTRARLLLLHLCSEAIRQKSPTIQIEDSLSSFIQSMGFQVTGGKNGTIASFKQQINALAACRMSIGVWNGSRAKTINAQPFSEIDVWLPTDPKQRSFWPSTITFSKDFFDTLQKHALPVNIHAIKHFANSPRKLDLLFWLGYRLNTVRKPLKISWDALKEQFGENFVRDRKFKEKFAEDIKHFQSVFPKLPIFLDDNGFTLHPGTTEALHLPKSSKK